MDCYEITCSDKNVEFTDWPQQIMVKNLTTGNSKIYENPMGSHSGVPNARIEPDYSITPLDTWPNDNEFRPDIIIIKEGNSLRLGDTATNVIACQYFMQRA